MKMRHLFACITLVLLAPLTHAQQLAPKALLPVDPAIKVVKLDNGFSCWIRSHNRPPGKVGMWLHISSGSINEDDNQRGLAHFLEHLAFNGTKHFPPGRLIKYFESLGLRFGQHQNAFTSFNQTTFTLSLPDTKDVTIGKGLLCLSDYAFRMSLVPEEVDKERKVILEELRARLSARSRMLDKLLPILLPGSRVAQRLPIGKEEILKKADRALIKSYYDKWYHPGNGTLLVVGDLKPAQIEKHLQKHFGEWPESENAVGDADPGISVYKKTSAATLTDPEKTNAEVSVISVRPVELTRTTADYRRDLVQNLGSWIFNRRMGNLVREGKAPFQNASAYKFPFLNVCSYIEAEASGEPAKSEEMLTSLLVELKRAREHGFLTQELEDGKRALLASADQRAKTEATRDARAFLSSMNSSIERGRMPMSAKQSLNLMGALLPTIGLAEVSSTFKTNFNPANRLVLATMPDKKEIKVPSKKALLAIASKAEQVRVEPLQAKERPKALLTELPEPGKVVETAEEPDLKILSTTLSNGVRLHLREMDFRKNQVTAHISIAGGKIRETEKTRGLTQAAGLVFSQPASKHLSSTQIRDLMTGKKVNVSGGASEDMLTVTVQGSPEDLEQGFQLAHLLLTSPKIEKAALDRWKKQMEQTIQRQKTSVESQLWQRIAQLLSNNDPRADYLTLEQVNATRLVTAQKWLDGILRTGPIEASIVGDIKRGKALSLAIRYLGSLPARSREDKSLDALRKVTRKDGPLKSRLEVETITPRAVVFVGWRAADWKAVKERRTTQIASQILSSRLRKEIREDRGLTYSTACFSRPSKEYEGTSFIGCYFTADPEKATAAAAIARSVIEQFANEGPTVEEMATVRKQFKNIIEQSQKNPSYWASVLSDLEYHHTEIEDVKEALQRYTSYTKADIMDAMKKFIVAKERFEVIALPKKKADAKN
ncbi:MAG: insulinase family protein [Planctomycetota bacterium]|nr:insulinase family protein [Planctomycetota bacterium]